MFETVAHTGNDHGSVSRRAFLARALTGGAAAAVIGLSSNSAVFASRATPQRGNLPGWREIFHDDFSKQVNRSAFPSAVSEKWDAYRYPWKDTSKKGRYDPDNVVSVQDGVLTKSLRTIKGMPRVAAITPKVTSTAPYGFLYGRYEVRFRADRFKGYKFVALLWPDNGTNISGSASGRGGNGEIDFPELDLEQEHAMGFVHHQDATHREDQAWMRSDADPREWHTYTLEWSPNLVVAYVDGAEIGRTTERVPNTPMHLVLQSETSIRHPTHSSHKGNVQIGWVTVWAYDPQQSSAPAPSPARGTPTLWTTWPGVEGRVSGTVPLQVGGRDLDDVQAVRWYVDGRPVDYDGSEWPWKATFDSRSVRNGRHSVFAKAKLADGLWITSPVHEFIVAN